MYSSKSVALDSTTVNYIGENTMKLLFDFRTINVKR